jgi:hypothetical protein
MKIWESVTGLMLWPWTKVPWGLDRGVSDAEFERYRSAYFRSMVAYMAALMFVAIASDHLPKSCQFLAALVPFAISAWFVFALIRYVAHWDELQRRIMAESGAAATVCGLALLLTYRYMQDVGLPHLSLASVILLFVILWIIALPIVRKQYEQ